MFVTIPMSGRRTRIDTSITAIEIELKMKPPTKLSSARPVHNANPARSTPIVRRAAYLATVVWACFFGLRLAVQVPLYLAQATAALAATKLLMGLPLYAALLWVTWLMMRSALAAAAR